MEPSQDNNNLQNQPEVGGAVPSDGVEVPSVPTSGVPGEVPNEVPGEAPGEVPSATTNDGGDVVFNDKPKRNMGVILTIVLLALLAVGGIGFGVWAMTDGNSRVEKKDKQISELQKQLTEKSKTQEKEEDETEEEEEEMAEDTDEGNVASNEAVNTTDYIYVGEWGLKIKIPDELKRVSYNYLGGVDVYGYLYVSGVYGESDELPDFANTAMHASGLGVVSRYTLDANSAENSSVYLGELVFNDDEYNYYYSGPQAYYSVDENERQLEISSIGLVKQMLSDKNNYSKI